MAETSLFEQLSAIAADAVRSALDGTNPNLPALMPPDDAAARADLDALLARARDVTQAADPAAWVSALDGWAGAWQQLARYQGMAAAVAELLSPDAISRTHAAAHQAVASLLARGQADGSFRADLPAGWLTEACIALMHTCADGVRAGRVDPAEAGRILTASVHALFTTTKEPG